MDRVKTAWFSSVTEMDYNVIIYETWQLHKRVTRLFGVINNNKKLKIKKNDISVSETDNGWGMMRSRERIKMLKL